MERNYKIHEIKGGTIYEFTDGHCSIALGETWVGALFDNIHTLHYVLASSLDWEVMEEKQNWLKENEPVIGKRQLTLEIIKELEFPR